MKKHPEFTTWISIFGFMVVLMILLTVLFSASSCTPVIHTARTPIPGTELVNTKSYLVKKTKPEGAGTIARLKGRRYWWYFPTDTLKAGNRVTIYITR